MLIVAGAGVVVADPGTADATLQEMDGSGTQDDPYVITNVEELQAMQDGLGAHYVLGTMSTPPGPQTGTGAPVSLRSGASILRSAGASTVKATRSPA